MSSASRHDIPVNDRASLIRDVFRIEYLTIVWMVIEAVVAIASAIVAISAIDKPILL